MISPSNISILAKTIHPLKNTSAWTGNGTFTRLDNTMSYNVLIIPHRAYIECPMIKPIAKLLVDARTNIDPPASVIISIYSTYFSSITIGLILNFNIFSSSSKSLISISLKVSELLKCVTLNS